MNWTVRWIDRLTLLLVCAVVGVFAYRYYAGSSPLDVLKAGRTLVMVVEQGCDFCEANLPFYRRIIARRNEEHYAVRIIVAAPARDADIGDYLRAHGVQADAIIHPGAGALPVRIAPTLLLIDAGMIRKRWEGALSADMERVVLAEVLH